LHPEIEDAGTYFYHSHVFFQAVSAQGSLIVEAPEEPYHYDEERIVLLSDFFNKTDTNITTGLLSDPFVWSGESAGILVGGLGSNYYGPSHGPMNYLHVKPGKTYRFRFIGSTALSYTTLAFQGHDELTVIEADGAYTKPYKVDHLEIGSGQRYSVLLKTKTKAQLEKDGLSGNYFLQLENRERPTVTQSFAVLTYNRKVEDIKPPTKSVITLPPTTRGFLDYKLSPLIPNDFPTAAEVTRRVVVTVQQIAGNLADKGATGLFTWEEDGVPWMETFPKAPYLVSLYENNASYLPDYDTAVAAGGLDKKTRTFPVKIGEVLEIVWQNEGATNGGLDIHPFHAHGRHIYDIGSGNGTYDPAVVEKNLEGVHPIKRDTTMLYRYANSTIPGGKEGWRAWRLRATEPGVWMMHCHTLQHMIMGMQTVWVFGDSSDILKVEPDVAEGYLTYGGSAYGNETHDPNVMHWFDSNTGGK
jgi:L-ascorbate oxidase